MTRKEFPEQCSSCEHYDNMNGVCRFANAYVDYVCHCRHWTLCKEFKDLYNED